jgi:hypothetical protein
MNMPKRDVSYMSRQLSDIYKTQCALVSIISVEKMGGHRSQAITIHLLIFQRLISFSASPQHPARYAQNVTRL